MPYESFTDCPLSLTKKNALEKILCQYICIYHILPSDYSLCVSTVYSSNNGHFPQCFYMNLEANVSFFGINFEIQNFWIKGCAHLKC